MDDNEISAEIIQAQMQDTRDSLTEKLETLEQKVAGTVENATTAVTDTVDAIKETVHETVASVQEGVKDSVDSVKEFLDLPAHVQEHPWLMLGGSVAVGYCLGTLLAPNSQPRFAPAPTGSFMQTRPEGVSQVSSSEPGIWESEVTKLKGLALGVLFGTAREMLVSALPKEMGEQMKNIVDNVTKKMGGEPLPGSDWAKMKESDNTRSEQSPEKNPMSNERPGPGIGNGHPATRRW